jgi:uncharacterized membrane protein
MLAAGELIGDKLPFTPDRRVLPSFGLRLILGAVVGATVSSPDERRCGAVAGLLGTVIGTLGGHAARAKLARIWHKDWPAALLEDAGAVRGALLAVRGR